MDGVASACESDTLTLEEQGRNTSNPKVSSLPLGEKRCALNGYSQPNTAVNLGRRLRVTSNSMVMLTLGESTCALDDGIEPNGAIDLH